MKELSLGIKIQDIVDEYEKKKSKILDELKKFEKCAIDLKSSACVFGEFGMVQIDTGHIHVNTLESSLLKSAWYYTYKKLNIKTLASAKDKKLFNQSMASPPEFNMENIKASFGEYIMNPWDSILRGLAEVFCDLDPAYKSHEKMKIGVKGLPKRVIISGVDSIHGWGRDKIESILNALAAYQNKPLITHDEIKRLFENGCSLLESSEISIYGKSEPVKVPPRGVWLKKFKNGNGHLFFDKETLKDINMALSEYYGDVLADCHVEVNEKRQSTEVSKDLQYYPTPKKVVDYMLSNIGIREGDKVLEPSCGCGRIMDKVVQRKAECIGYEVDLMRAEIAKQKGHKVVTSNFLESIPKREFDFVIMNPPFYGKHYANHINHAMKFLKDGGKLISVLPSTARYDHGLVDGRWYDLPLGSFRESGVNVNTSVLTKVFRLT